jgi:hypothetical protein
MTITSDQIVAIASVLGALAVIYGIVSKPFKAIEELKESMEEVKESVESIDKAVMLHGDMIYELLEHASTNNNTGGMAEVKRRFDAEYRHNGR